uniref:Uncharacterized protein n=1 Tax=Anguilla anguilla TaxID=7936 RepID=A0A0E9UF46_ANGAN
MYHLPQTDSSIIFIIWATVLHTVTASVQQQSSMLKQLTYLKESWSLQCNLCASFKISTRASCF